jgi:hypothetical protein
MQKGRRMKGTSPNRKGPEQRSGKAEIRVLEGLPELVRAASLEFLRQARWTVRKKGLFFAALSGGSTPRPLYSLLADHSSVRAEVPWEKTLFLPCLSARPKGDCCGWWIRMPDGF